MRTTDGRQVELSQEGDYNGIKPGDKFRLNCVEQLVIGFSNNLLEANSPFSLIGVLGKGEKEVELWEIDGPIAKLKKSIKRAGKPMTADTAEEEIRNFLNS